MNELDLSFGAQVFCTDGKCGTLGKVAVDPATWQVTHVIVEEGFLLKKSRVFPFSSLERTAPGEIYLATHSGELQNYPVYREETVERVAPGQSESGTTAFWSEGVPYGVGPATPLLTISEKIRHGLPSNLVVVDRGTSVEGLEGNIGKLDHLRADAETGKLTELIVRHGVLLTSQRVLPASLASAISEDGIFVEVTAEEVEGLPEYQAENDEAPSLQRNEVSESDNMGRPAANGGNMDLTTQVARALAEDPRTSDAVIEVIDERGVITLDGEVDGVEAREAAKEIAAAQPGVTAVVNLLRIRN